MVKEPTYEAPETNCGYLHRGLVLNLVKILSIYSTLNRIGERLCPKLRLGQLGLVELYTLTGFIYPVLSECLTFITQAKNVVTSAPGQSLDSIARYLKFCLNLSVSPLSRYLVTHADPWFAKGWIFWYVSGFIFNWYYVLVKILHSEFTPLMCFFSLS